MTVMPHEDAIGLAVRNALPLAASGLEEDIRAAMDQIDEDLGFETDAITRDFYLDQHWQDEGGSPWLTLRGYAIARAA